jgi:hypothetical protein
VSAAATACLTYFIMPAAFLCLPFQGDYPSLMRERCGDRLPRFNAEQRAMLMGSVDFFGLNRRLTSYIS